METQVAVKSEPLLSKRRVGAAGIAAIIGCAACCALPLLAAVGVGSGSLAAAAAFLEPGSELLVAVTVFGLTLGVMAIRARTKKNTGCGPTCKVDGSCCGTGG